MYAKARPRRSRLAALAGLLVLTSAAEPATRPLPSAAMTIAPTQHDFGSAIIGSPSLIFTFTVTLPPGGGPTDSVVVKVTGPDVGDFLVNTLISPAGTSFTTCKTPAWRRGGCDVVVQFIPQARGVRNATLDVSDTRGNRATASLTGTGVFGCRPNLVSCNYVSNYSGTFSWSSVLNIQQGVAAGPHHNGDQSYSVTVQVTNGVATCQGSSSETMSDFEGSRLDRSKKSNGVISGPGLIAVEFMKDSGQLVYEITASCPSAHITETYTDHISNETSTTTLNAKPADWRDRTSMDRKPASAIGIDLSGSQTGPAPDEDPSNGVTGTMTFTWSLKRN